MWRFAALGRPLEQKERQRWLMKKKRVKPKGCGYAVSVGRVLFFIETGWTVLYLDEARTKVEVCVSRYRTGWKYLRSK